MELRQRISDLIQVFSLGSPLPPRSQADVDMIHAFRLLAHAEIQKYIEDVALGILEVSKNSLHFGVITKAAHYLVVYNQIVERIEQHNGRNRMLYPPFRSVEVLNSPTFSMEFEKAFKKQLKSIKGNSGIKVYNLANLLSPLGYRNEAYDPGFLLLMENFGSERGDVAHGSGIISAQQWPSASTELARIRQIMRGLEGIGQMSVQLNSPIR